VNGIRTRGGGTHESGFRSGLAKAVKKLTDDKRPEVIASAVEFILEGLHLSRKLNCDRSGESAVYKR